MSNTKGSNELNDLNIQNDKVKNEDLTRKIDFWGKRMNKEKKLIEKNIELSAEFSRYLFEHPEVQEKIPIDSEIILLPDYDQELKEFNLGMGKDIEAGGGNSFY